MNSIASYIFLGCRLSMGALLIMGGVVKLFNVKEFRRLLTAHNTLPEVTVSTVAVLVPLLETLIGMALLFNGINPGAEWASFALFLFFGCFIAITLLRGTTKLPCGCFGSSSGTISWQLVLRNLAFAGLSLAGAGGAYVGGALLTTPFALLLLVRLYGEKETHATAASGD